MKATEAKLLAFLKKSPQFVIPIYQRTYSWTDKECRQLWDDIVRAGTQKEISAHFVGSIVYIEEGMYQVSVQSPLLVIDGQQRLTTVSLLLAALATALGDTEPVDGFSAKKLRNYYLTNPEESGDRRHKLLLSQTDKATLIAIVDGAPLPKDVSLRVKRNHELFTEWLATADLTAVCNGLAKLVVVDIALSRDQDNPQLIFESMNSTGRELSQADLIRNFVLMGLDHGLQSKLYEQYWRPMETDFGQEAYGIHFDGFMRHYLTMKTGDIPNVDQVYDAFKKYARAQAAGGNDVETLVADVRAFAQHYCAIALGAEKDPALHLAFQDLRELRVDVAYPFLLDLYDDHAVGLLSAADFVSIVRLIESYVFRRAICAIPTNSLNKTFAGFGRQLKRDRHLESVRAHLQLLPSYRRFPPDEEFLARIVTRDLYNFRSRSYWLRRLENHGRKERVPVDQYTIEHVMPQNENLSAAWRAALGPEWQRIQATWLHTLGNLTLTGYNSEYSDKPFPTKRDMEGGFAESPLRLNASLAHLDTWDEAAIQHRATQLAALAAKVWVAPALPADVLAEYRAAPSSGAPAPYTLDDHPHLLVEPMKSLFQALRTEILALDPGVTEDILKLYVAFKAETNFVDVVPQAKRLRLSLNMEFPDLIDPRGLAKDVAGIGRWGNGDVEVGLSTIDDLPYVMGLIKQSLQRQLGNGDAGA